MGKRRKRARRALASQTPIVMAPKTPVVVEPKAKKSAFVASAPPKAASPKKNKKVTRSVHPDVDTQQVKKTSQEAVKPVTKEDVAEDASSKADK